LFYRPYFALNLNVNDMKVLVSILSLTIFMSAASANNNNGNTEPKKVYSISGQVKDVNEFLTGVKVILDGKETIVYTDFEGNFTINNVVEGQHTISFSLVAYDNKEVVFNPNEKKNLVVEMEAK